MSVLTLVRHAQARPFEADPDRLSAIGQEQARALAEYWARNGAAFDEVWCGSLTRHLETAGLVAQRFPEWPPPRIAAEWNEYDVASAVRRFGSSIEPGPDYNRRFQKMLEPAMLAWLNCQDHSGAAWAYRAFRERVLCGLRRIQEGPSQRRVLVFTSGGPIGLLVQTALGAPDEAFLDAHWRVRNCSLTEFVFTGDRLSLDYFNAIPHLRAARLRTFR